MDDAFIIVDDDGLVTDIDGNLALAPQATPVPDWEPSVAIPAMYPASPAQRRYVRYLAGSRDHRGINPGMARVLADILSGTLDVPNVWDKKYQKDGTGLAVAGRDVGAIIDALLECPELPASEQAPKPGAAGLDLSALPAGTYAHLTGGARVLIRVDRPDTGKWSGWVFVRSGSEYARDTAAYGYQRPGGTYTTKTTDVTEALTALVADPVEGLAAYGRLTGVCAVCGRTLEDEESVRRGIGPVCWGRLVDNGTAPDWDRPF